MNTSFNLRGEAIVHTPTDAVRTFYSSGMDALVIGSYLPTVSFQYLVSDHGVLLRVQLSLGCFWRRRIESVRLTQSVEGHCRFSLGT
jgi:hypothetical protein